MNPREIRLGIKLQWSNNQSELDITIPIITDAGFWNQIKKGDIEPIPLTEDWLKKFGFEKEMCLRNDVYENKQLPHYQFRIEGFDSDIVFQDHTNSFERVEKGDDKYGQHGWYVASIFKENQTGIAMIYYVHQLQNLYFMLTGEELAAK